MLVRLRGNPVARVLAWLAGVALVVTLVSCSGGAGGLTESPPDGGGEPISPPSASARFDLSGAVGLQLGSAGASALRVAATESGLTKVLSDGSLEDALVEGEVIVTDFVIRNGKVYVLLSPTVAEPCVLGEVAPDGAMTCVDAELTWINVDEIQFDASGGIYYRGGLDDGSTVIRRNRDGSLIDYYVARDATYIERFLVTRSGIVLAEGRTTGALGRERWIRQIDADGRVTVHPEGRLIGFLPDGTILADINPDGNGIPGMTRFLVHDGVRIDERSYCARADGPVSGARFVVDFACSSPALQSRINGQFYRSATSAVALTGSGLFQYYPTVERIDLPFDRLTNGTIRADRAVVSGYGGSGEPEAYLVDLASGVQTDIMGTARIEVLRFQLELDRERVVMYGLDLDRNQPVLAEYDLRAGVLNVADIDAELADTFEVLDLSVSQVPPEPTAPTPDVVLEASVLDGFDAGDVSFDASATTNLPWVDSISWSFGDGTVVSDDASLVTIVHAFDAPGTYEVTVTMTTFLGDEYAASRQVTVAETLAHVGVVTAGTSAITIDEAGQAWSWGQGEYGMLGTGGTADEALPVPVVMPAGVAFTELDASAQATPLAIALDAVGNAWVWGGVEDHTLIGTEGQGSVLVPSAIAMPDGVLFTSISTGSSFALALDQAGQAWAWGWGSSLGTGGSTPRLEPLPVPVDMPEGVSFTAIEASFNHSLALDEAGQAWAWGIGSAGQLGTGSTNDAPLPVRVEMPGVARFTEIAAGDFFSLALDEAGQAWAWGSGQSGTGQSGVLLEPTAVVMPGDTRFVTMSAGSRHVLALDQDGQAWAWGLGSLGQLGIGDEVDFQATPTRVDMPPGTAFTVVSAERDHSLALDETGSVWAWGTGYPQNSSAQVLSPVRVQGR